MRAAFVHGMDVMLWTCAGTAIATAALALAFLPRHSGPVGAGPAETIPAGTGERGPDRAGLAI